MTLWLSSRQVTGVSAEPSLFLLRKPYRTDLWRILAAVQQNKKSPSKRGMHRSHNALGTPGTAIEPTTGEVHLRHHISPTGFYRGRKVLKGRRLTPPDR